MKRGVIWGLVAFTILTSLSIISCGSATKSATTNTTAAAKLFLNVTSPADKSSVTNAQTTVTGETLPTAIVSIDGVLVKVGADGSFSSSVPLQLGPNVVQVVASDISDNQVGKVLFVGRIQ